MNRRLWIMTNIFLSQRKNNVDESFECQYCAKLQKNDRKLNSPLEVEVEEKDFNNNISDGPTYV